MRLLLTTPDAPARSAAAVATTAPADLVLDGARHQTWEGWGGCFNELGSDALALLPADPGAVRLGLRGSLNACTLSFANPDG